MLDLLYFLSDLLWGLVGLFREATTHRAKRYRLVGLVCLISWLVVWGLAWFIPEEWQFVPFLAGVALFTVGVFCGYMRLGESGERRNRRRKGEPSGTADHPCE
jgi:hypothetical protein